MTRAVNGRFVAGASGNPGGRPKELAGVRELAAQHTEAAVAALVRALDDPKTSVAAAVALLDRGWGKPQQAIELSQPDHVRQVAPPDIMALIARHRNLSLSAPMPDSPTPSRLSVVGSGTSVVTGVNRNARVTPL